VGVEVPWSCYRDPLETAVSVYGYAHVNVHEPTFGLTQTLSLPLQLEIRPG